ncbi:hypothetical protein HELRODRAFT_67887 [Helobdella robusta]|uniref:Intraflagellar transport protein 81 homolog n=1 Tax=Helobdella robusta TaxID=6412 RepID=T1FZ70_HELRO|nr:hypothetical protein HELRODRAFT_67887 [Helobdella robusta]ESN96097.1 hypothetical protein HELRODRAFT_67887 [Helobdella robusta]
MNRLEEESNTNKYLVNERLPQEKEQLKRMTNELQRIALEPAMGQSDLDEIQQQIRTVNLEINKLIEAKMKTMDDGEGKARGGELYRQQAAIVRNKKASTAETLNAVRSEMMKLEQECNDKRMKLREIGGGGDYLQGDEFKRFATQMRAKHTAYKAKKQELNELKTECGLLIRTNEILDKQSRDINEQLTTYESSKGVKGYHETQDALEKVSSQKGQIDDEKGKTLQDISIMVQQLNNQIDKKKATLAPIIKELRPLRQKLLELCQEHKELKTRYDTMQTGYGSNWSNLEKEVTSHKEDINSNESKIHYLKLVTKSMEALLQRAEIEATKNGVAGGNSNSGRSLREIFNRNIMEQENLNKQLKEKQKNLKDNQESNVKQAKSWRDLEKLMQAKLKLMTSSSSSGSAEKHPSNNEMESGKHQGKSSDRLVL